MLKTNATALQAAVRFLQPLSKYSACFGYTQSKVLITTEGSGPGPSAAPWARVPSLPIIVTLQSCTLVTALSVMSCSVAVDG